MKEDFIHYLWQYQSFDKNELCTNRQETVQVVHPGQYNHDAGPDFRNAKISIGGVMWCGSVEIHIRSSDWFRHQHHQDKAYDQVVLHVVWQHDTMALRTDGTTVPTISLASRVAPSLLLRYQQFYQFPFKNSQKIPCEKLLPDAESLQMHSMLETMLVQRLEKKSETVLAILQANRGDWLSTAYFCLVRGFGFKVNKEAFELLGSSVPFAVILKVQSSQKALEALLLGQAGLLDADFQDEYLVQLQREYSYLSHKFSLQHLKMNAGLWKFSRMRPQNFPTIRIAQLCSLLWQGAHQLEWIIQATEWETFYRRFSPETSAYWQQHYYPEKKASNPVRKMGKESMLSLMINVFIPLKYAYARYYQHADMAAAVIEQLMRMPAEKNSIISKYLALNFPVTSSYDSQAILELNREYCSMNRCLQCRIGASILRQTKFSEDTNQHALGNI